MTPPFAILPIEPIEPIEPLVALGVVAATAVTGAVYVFFNAIEPPQRGSGAGAAWSWP